MTQLREESVLQRLLSLEDAVREIKLGLTRVSAALDNAQRRPAEEASAPSLESDSASIQKILSRARAQRILASFPHELLRAIFLSAQDGVNDIWAEDIHLSGWTHGSWDWILDKPRDRLYDIDDARLPFVLAAVNRRWRSIVLDFPNIWSFVGVPSVNDTNGAAVLEYVHLAFSRSQNQVLDIVLAWSDTKWEDSSYYSPILDAVGLETDRWRRVSITVPRDAPKDATQFLRLPMRRLESLSLVPSKYNSIHPSIAFRPSYLPHCPQLRCLRNEFVIEPIWRTHRRLTVLNMYAFYLRPSLVWEALKLLPTLQQLNVRFESFDTEDPLDESELQTGPPDRLTLTHLRGLGLQGHYALVRLWLNKLDMPCLYHLRVFDLGSLELMGGILHNIAATVTTVTIYGFGKSDDAYLHALEPLREVRHLVLRDCVWVGHSLVRTLASRTAARLPRLQSIAFENVKLDGEQASHLSDLMHALCANPGGGVTFSLVAKPELVPKWLLRQYKFLKCDRNASSLDVDGVDL